MLKNLKLIRMNKKLTLKQLSQKTGISKTYLNDLENLKRISPSYKNINKLLDILQVTLEELEDKK